MKKLIFAVVAITGLLLTGYAGLRGYKVWKQDRMLDLARQFLAESDDRNAFLSLRQAIQSNPGDPEGYRLMAQLAEKERSPEAVILRSRVVELAPESVDDHLALARTALAYGDVFTSSNALQELPDIGKRSAKYHNIAGTLAIVTGQDSVAEIHWLEAARLDPTNRIPPLNVAVIRLRNTNEQVRAEGRATLLKLTKDPQVNCMALRELIIDGGRSGQTNEVEKLVEQLVQQTNSVFTDQLIELDLLRKKQSSAFSPKLAALKAEAASDPAKIHSMATWQIDRLGAAEALSWMRTLPADVQTNQPVALLTADCLSALKDWPGLQSWLEAQRWGDLEFMRHALMYRALRAQNLNTSAKTSWEQAVKSAQIQKHRLTALLRLSAQWDMAIEQEQLLWIFVRQFPAERWAPQTLAKLLHGRGQTQGLLALYSQLSKARPSDLHLKNNLAMTGLLLGAQQVDSHALAEEVYRTSPTNVHFVSTYALSLYLQDKRTEALELMEQLPESELKEAQIAAYYAMFLQAAGKRDKATPYFEAAIAARLLPEEERLIERAKQL